VFLPLLAGSVPLPLLEFMVEPQRFHAAFGQCQGSPRLPGLGVALAAYGPPNHDGGRERRFLVGIAVKVDVVPGERA
jgi:hypothetical protein